MGVSILNDVDIQQQTRQIKNITQSNFLRVKNRSGYRINSYKVNVKGNVNSMCEEFGKVHKDFVGNCERFFSHECNRVDINNEVYQELLHFASSARYRLMYLHQEAQRLFQKYSEMYWKTTALINVTPHEKHVAHMTKVLSEKYNIIPKTNAKESQPTYYLSQAHSPPESRR